MKSKIGMNFIYIDIFEEIEWIVYLLKRFPGNPVPLNEGLNPGGIGEICGNGKDDGGKGMCGLGPGNML